MAVDENKLPNGRVDFHGKHPGPLPKEKPLKLADFYAARISTPPTLQWMVLSPPYTTRRASDLSGIISEIRSEGAVTLRAIAAGLNSRGIPTAKGGSWSAVQVSRVLEKMA